MDGEKQTERCPYCESLCTSDNTRKAYDRFKRRWYQPSREIDEFHFTCPVCGYAWWRLYYYHDHEVTRTPSPLVVNDPEIRRHIQTVMMDRDEQVRIWEEIQKEVPDFSLLDDELKEVCISIAEGERDWYANNRHLMRIETTDHIGGNYRCIRTIYDIELALRVRHAMRSYIARIIEAQRHQRNEEQSRKIAKYDAMLDSDRGE